MIISNHYHHHVFRWRHSSTHGTARLQFLRPSHGPPLPVDCQLRGLQVQITADESHGSPGLLITQLDQPTDHQEFPSAIPLSKRGSGELSASRSAGADPNGYQLGNCWISMAGQLVPSSFVGNNELGIATATNVLFFECLLVGESLYWFGNFWDGLFGVSQYPISLCLWSIIMGVGFDRG